MTKAAQLAEFNMEAAQLLGDLAEAETALQVSAALDAYDEAVNSKEDS
jgi:hypothetical protein